MNHKPQLEIKAGLPTKGITFLLVFVLIGSVIPTLVSATEQESYTETFTFSAPSFHQEQEYTEMTIEGTNGFSAVPGAPSLPMKRGSIWLPPTAGNIEVSFSYDSQQTMVPEGQIIEPSPVPRPLTMDESLFDINLDTFNEEIYTGGAFGEVFTYRIEYGLNPNDELAHVIVYEITPTWFTSVADGTLNYITNGDLFISYTVDNEPLQPTDDEVEYDFLILAPNSYISDLQPLVTHKEDMGLSTLLVSLDEIYNEVYFELTEEEREQYNHDNAETIKYFIYNAKMNWDVDYVMAVGGYRTFFGINNPSKQFPIRWVPDSHQDEPGYVTDQYFSCCIKQNVVFDSWNTNGNDEIGELTDGRDYHTDVHFGRLACRNRMEVRTLVDTIITYETETYDSDWFKKVLTVTGDGFQDVGFFTDLTVDWFIFDVPNGVYTIKAQSSLWNDDSVVGPIDEVKVIVDHSAPSRVTFTEDDHEKVEPIDEDQEAVYPGKPVAEIVVPSNDDVLGNTAIQYSPPEAYHSGENGWGYVSYYQNTLQIKSKSYDPTPKFDLTPQEQGGYIRYPNAASDTKLTVWVEDSEGNTLEGFPVEKRSKLWYEGEMECQKALNYMPDMDINGNGFEEIKLWTSNGQWTGMADVIEAISEGHGFLYFAGHGNPMSWGDHLPGIPGGRDDGMINGLKNVNLDFGLARYESEAGDAFFPMDQITNGYKQQVTLIGGCHNSYIDASLSKLLYDPEEVLFTVLHGAWVPESFAWWLARMPQGGSISTIGCSGLGYGYLGDLCLSGLGGWINPEFFRVYSQEGFQHLGEVFSHTLNNFADGNAPLGFDDKTFEEWVLLGDPSLKIGGYEPETAALPPVDDVTLGEIKQLPGGIQCNITNNMNENLTYFTWQIEVRGDAPLARYFGLAGTVFEGLLRGKVMSGGITSEQVVRLRPDETLEIAARGISGFGHVLITVSVDIDDESLAETSEDGFLLGSRLMLYHPRE